MKGCRCATKLQGMRDYRHQHRYYRAGVHTSIGQTIKDKRAHKGSFGDRGKQGVRNVIA